MIRVCVADNHPVVHYGIKAFFKGHPKISISAGFNNFADTAEMLKMKNFDILIIDLELQGLASINTIKTLLRDHPKTKIIIYTNLSEQIYTPNAIKAGVSAYVHKNNTLDSLETTIGKVMSGEIIFSEDIRKKLAMISKQNKNERIYRKLSSREIEVLRYLSDGKKNNEIAKILDLNEKTISTYKLRLLNKLNVTNLVDLVNKAKTLEVV